MLILKSLVLRLVCWSSCCWRLSGGNGGRIRIQDFPEDGRLAQSGCESLAGGGVAVRGAYGLDAGLRRSKALTDAASRTTKAESSIKVITGLALSSFQSRMNDYG